MAAVGIRRQWHQWAGRPMGVYAHIVKKHTRVRLTREIRYIFMVWGKSGKPKNFLLKILRHH